VAVNTGRLAGLEIQSGAVPVDSAPEEQSSTRCELQGILGWMATIEKLLGRQATGTIEAGCDSDAALKGIKKWMNKKTRNESNAGSRQCRSPLGDQSSNVPITRDDCEMGKSEGAQ
jgi:ribonuclease HI